MIQNYLKFALRNLLRHKGFTAINLTGLVIGLSACLLLVLYVSHELGFDRFHAKKDRIYRINYDVLMGGTTAISPSVPVFVGPVLKEKFSEIEDATRFSSEWRPRTIRYGDIMFDEPGFCYADPNFFNILDFKAVRGDLKTALSRPNTLVITETMVRKYFGDQDPIGRVLNFNNKKDFEVVAVMEDVPADSHFSFNFLTSHYSIEDFAASERLEQWNNPEYTTWLLLAPGADPAALAAKIENWVNPPEEGNGQASESSLHLPIEALTNVHFNTQVENFGNKLAITDPKQLGVFGVIAGLILLIACVNYVNLATARASIRAKEVGVRKASGARSGQLVAQFLGESFLLLLPAIALAVAVVGLTLPALNQLLDKHIPFRLFEAPFLAGMGAGWLLLSLLAGLYPAWVLSGFQPVTALKSSWGGRKNSGATLRKGLVVFQFAISTALIVGTVVVGAQLRYMQSKKLGLDREQVVFIRGNADLRPQLQPFCEKISALGGVETAARVWRSPFETVIGNGFSLKPDPTGGDDWHLVGGISADEHYLPALGLELIAGRNFDPAKIPGDSATNEFIVNEAFLRHYNLKPEEAVGRRSLLGNAARRGPGTIVGVVRDFHTHSLRDQVEPVVVFNDPEYFGAALLRIGAGQDVNRVLAQVESAWKSVVPMRPFNYTFLDSQYEAMYRSEQRMATLIALFSGLAILVACLGLFGLAAFMVSQRTREIGIRKVLGASARGISNLLIRDFIRLVLIGIVVASPLAYYFMQQWLANFAFRIDLQWWMFAAAGVAAVVVALLTVGFQSMRAALADPVKSLRSE